MCCDRQPTQRPGHQQAMPRRVFCRPRFTSFLIALCRYQLSLQHLAGSANLPSDFASRNTSDRNAPLCVICSFILETENSVVILSVFFQDIERMASIYHSPSGPHGLVSKMINLCHICAHLKQGLSVEDSNSHKKDVMQYLNIAMISNDG